MHALKIKWHEFMYQYRLALYNSCLDEQLRDKLHMQMQQHQNILFKQHNHTQASAPLLPLKQHHR